MWYAQVCTDLEHIQQLRTRSSKNTHFKAQTPFWALVVFHTVRCGDYWCKIDGVYARALLKISNSPFCVIPLHSCLFVRAFVSFFLDSKQIFFFGFVISCSPIQLYTLFYLQQLYFICSNFILFAAGFFNLQQLYLICSSFLISACPLWATVAMSTCSCKQRTLFCEVCPVYLTNRMCFSFCHGTLIYSGVRHHRDRHVVDSRGTISRSKKMFLRAEKGIAWHIDASSVVCTLFYNSKFADQIARKKLPWP